MEPVKHFSITLADLERSAKVPLDEQVESQDVDQPTNVLSPEDLERQRLLGISGAAG